MKDKGKQLKDTIKQHILNNKKEYIIVTLLFIIGIFLGVIFINNIQEAQKVEIESYLKNFIQKMQETEKLDYKSLLTTSIKQNLFLGTTLWFFGTTVIGIPVVFGIVLYRGFCLGYTISASISIMNMGKGLAFALTNLLLPNMLLIPAVLAISVSGFKLYKSIVKDNGKENIKIEIIRHIIFSLIMLGILFIASLLEIFVATNIFKIIVKYF